MVIINKFSSIVKLLIWIIIGIYGNQQINGSPILREIQDLTNIIEPQEDVITSRPIDECIFMALDEGHYHLHAPGSTKTCGIYILAEASKQVVLTFDDVDVSCADGGLVSVVDGWENNGEFFPSISDHHKSLSHRFHEFCGDEKPRNIYVASQNAAMIQYRIPRRGHGFRITIQFIENLRPCNAILQGYHGTYTIRNYGLNVNCSVSAIFPAHIDIMSMNVGVQRKQLTPPQQQHQTLVEMETGVQNTCSKRGELDYVEIIGSNGMDPLKATPSTTLCGLDSNPENVFANIFCGTSTVRLVSSGTFENTVSLLFRQMDLDDLLLPHVACD